jgi:hypothetical protein
MKNKAIRQSGNKARWSEAETIRRMSKAKRNKRIRFAQFSMKLQPRQVLRLTSAAPGILKNEDIFGDVVFAILKAC